MKPQHCSYLRVQPVQSVASYSELVFRYSLLTPLVSLGLSGCCLALVGCQFEDTPAAVATQSSGSKSVAVPAAPRLGDANEKSNEIAAAVIPAPDSKPGTQSSAKPSVQSVDRSHAMQAQPVSSASNVIHRRGKKYHAGQLHYNLSTGLLVFEADIRARRILKKYFPYMSQYQADRAVALAKSYDPEFQRLRRERAKILASAASSSQMEDAVLDNQLDIIDLVARVRLQVATEIMTEEQIKTARADFQRQSVFK